MFEKKFQTLKKIVKNFSSKKIFNFTQKNFQNLI